MYNVSDWDQSQTAVVESLPRRRLVVSAGPGTGKTAVACGRIAYLVKQYGVSPSNVQLISFTRTAVREARDRISAYLDDEAEVHEIRMATLDSQAWAIHYGFAPSSQGFGSYTENIRSARDLVMNNEGVMEYLQGIEHLLVDEAQDIVGERADLVVAMIAQLLPTCGFTVFADEAQAIYGFTEFKEADTTGNLETGLLPLLRKQNADDLDELELSEVHRTRDVRLKKIFTEVRQQVLDAEDDCREVINDVRRSIKSLAHGVAQKDNVDIDVADGDVFILYRRRSDVLLGSALLRSRGIHHRIRMSGLPICIPPWVGATLSEFTDRLLSRDAFEHLWSINVGGSAIEACRIEEAWNRLARIGGYAEGLVSMDLLRQRLGVRQPPADLSNSVFGVEGPILGTIHASKGREADIVHLLVPRWTSDEVDHLEEARVLFVGATRARSQLLVGESFGPTAERLDGSGRAYRLISHGRLPKAQFEIGLSDDVIASGLAGKDRFGTAESVRQSQSRIQLMSGRVRRIFASSNPDLDFSYQLMDLEHRDWCYGALSLSVNHDLFNIARAVQERTGNDQGRLPPRRLNHIYSVGARTIVVPPNSTSSEKLHHPWNLSGILLAPLVSGYTTAWFPESSVRKTG